MLQSTQENSEAALMKDIYRLSDSGVSVVQIRSRETVRTAMVLRRNLCNEHNGYQEWDVVNGFRTFTAENLTENLKNTGKQMDFPAALGVPLAELRKTGSTINADRQKVHYFVYLDAHPFIRNNPYCVSMIQQYASILPSVNVCVIFVTPEIAIDDVQAGTMVVADMHTPNVSELVAVLGRLIDGAEHDFPDGVDVSDEDMQQIAQMGLGLTIYEFETHAALAMIGATMGEDRATVLTKDILLEGIAVGKTEVVKQSEILELYATVDMSEVGGMKRLKDWVDSRKNCFTEEAKDFGIEPPKGAVVVGVPGTGKSLIAKAIASTLGIPLVRLDMGRVFSKFVGDSESRMRAALKMVETMAPCVLFSDEIDKGLGGAGGGGDSGTSSRVLGTFLTWLNDCKAPVFNMVTANKIDGLPPELLRKGRFDQIFAVGLPNAGERKEVLDIHLRKRGHEIVFDRQQWARFTEKSNGYVPAEIEQAVKDALITAFNSESSIGMDHIIQALEEMVPMSRSNAEKINAMLDWARNNAIPVNYEADEGAEPSAPGDAPSASASTPPARRTRTTRRA
jgi:AAA+ superfamily predicted ATPase